jgi:hypothetical protein
VVSVVVFVDSRIRQVQEARLARRPALVLRWNPHGQHWILANVGSGPALDIVLVQRYDGEWANALRMPELSAEGDAVVPQRWIEAFHGDPGLGARYMSVTGERYFTRTGQDVSTLSGGWDEVPASVWDDIEPHWKYDRPRPAS